MNMPSFSEGWALGMATAMLVFIAVLLVLSKGKP